MKTTPFNTAYTGERSDLVALITGNPQTILDVGCSVGTLGASLKKHFDCQVTGIEYCPDMAQEAHKKLDRVIQGDLNRLNLTQELKTTRFDTIICGDVLEHLINPWSLLQTLRTHLKPSGQMIASLPNIRHWDSLWTIFVKGYWPYRDRGVHDRTHLRFFTKRNVEELFSQANFSIESLSTTYRLVEEPRPINRWAPYFAWPFLKNFLAFQYLVSARPCQDNPL